MTLIIIALIIAALYSGVMYVIQFIDWIRNRDSYSYDLAVDVHNVTYHFGLCFILSIGFLGLIVK